MNNTLTIHEKYSKSWPFIAITSLLLSVVLFVSYWMVSDILLAGYLRLAAFGLFALGLLSLFKLKDGQVKITFQKDDDEMLHLVYEAKNRKLGEEKWASSEIKDVKIDEMPNRSLYNDIIQSDRCIRFRRNNNSEWMYLNKINGRVIPLNRQNAEEVYRFLKESGN